MQIGNREIGVEREPFVIAEMSGNHNQSLDRALAIVEAAAEASVHALKLQTYTADTMTLDLAAGEFYIDDPNSLWNGRSLYELYQQAHTPWEWHEPIFKRARDLGMIAFSTPFDETAVDFLETLDVPCYKIASFENTDLPLIRKVAATGKPMFISTGMATVAELDEAVRTARDAGCRDLILLKCTSSYPASPENSQPPDHSAPARPLRLRSRVFPTIHWHRGGCRCRRTRCERSSRSTSRCVGQMVVADCCFLHGSLRDGRASRTRAGPPRSRWARVRYGPSENRNIVPKTSAINLHSAGPKCRRHAH